MLNKQSSPISSINFLDQLSCQRDMGDNSAEILFLTFLQEALVSSSGMGRDVHSLMLSIQHSSASHGITHPPRSLKDGFGEVVVVCDMPDSCKFPSFDSCRKRFLWEPDFTGLQITASDTRFGNTRAVRHWIFNVQPTV